ncbi:TIGR03943 family protein [Clostridium tagluense]|uniref:TIGR03943 family putative permease subunit n=1 Tax=Clostridium tagluense TaxID=360422 RepID=UPI001C0DF953|nr:TIGR03943 family protein [Clostridium tagluense]MBU3129297.1 TIGR03943 family protein [Clostridium tagluense]MCB2312345.1 TIGR03943 family protein [Clostridium tagluense]MCB2317020.1 TIGR03943 family protein [Clostridium tagluense]MCB2321953.1 TIGR03943 family protein [Clostridium tagluense]MCB2326868.1 TIGR03943 family protein [Clostridium tagluense]
MQLMRLKKINIEVLLKLIILIGFAFFFYYIIKTDKVLLYVSPRIIPYMKFGIVAMILLSLFIAGELFKPKRKVNIKPYLFFIIPLFMTFLIPTASVSSKSMSRTTPKNVEKIVVTKQNNISDNNIIDTTKTTDTTNINASKVDKALKMEDNTIIINDNNFVKWVQEISYNMNKYEGKKIELTGFVFKDKAFKINEFVPARFMMSCCAADLQPVGLLCHYDKAKDLKQDTWILVKGKVEIIDYKGERIAIIVAQSIANAEKPKNQYVYPF